MERQAKIDLILNKLRKEELIRIIVQLAERDEQLSNTLLLQYGEGDHKQRLQAYSKLIKSIVKRYTGRDRFIPYRDTYKYAMEMIELLETFDAGNHVKLAFEAALLVLEEGIEAFQYADDSNGDIGMLVHHALEYINSLISSLNERDLEQREYMLNRLLDASKRGIFQGWDDFQLIAYRICAQLAESDKLLDKLRLAIESHIKVYAKQEFGQYTQEALLLLLYEIIEKNGSSQEAEQFREKHIRFGAFRNLEIALRMERGDYNAVIELSNAGLQQDMKFPGLVLRWKKAKYEAYKLLAYVNEQVLLAKELLLDGSYEYYQELEALVDGDHQSLYQDIVTELKQRKSWGARDVYLKLISDKNDVEEMMDYVRRYPSEIENYAAHLLAHYTEEVKQLYRKYINDMAATASNRSNYRRVCEVLKRYRSVVGKESLTEMIVELRAMYPRRSAFLDELNKLK